MIINLSILFNFWLVTIFLVHAVEFSTPKGDESPETRAKRTRLSGESEKNFEDDSKFHTPETSPEPMPKTPQKQSLTTVHNIYITKKFQKWYELDNRVTNFDPELYLEREMKYKPNNIPEKYTKIRKKVIFVFYSLLLHYDFMLPEILFDAVNFFDRVITNDPEPEFLHDVIKITESCSLNRNEDIILFIGLTSFRLAYKTLSQRLTWGFSDRFYSETVGYLNLSRYFSSQEEANFYIQQAMNDVEVKILPELKFLVTPPNLLDYHLYKLSSIDSLFSHSDKGNNLLWIELKSLNFFLLEFSTLITNFYTFKYDLIIDGIFELSLIILKGSENFNSKVRRTYRWKTNEGSRAILVKGLLNYLADHLLDLQSFVRVATNKYPLCNNWSSALIDLVTLNKKS